MGSPRYVSILYKDLINTWNALVVRKRSERFSEININFRRRRVIYHPSRTFMTSEKVKIK